MRSIQLFTLLACLVMTLPAAHGQDFPSLPGPPKLPSVPDLWGGGNKNPHKESPSTGDKTAIGGIRLLTGATEAKLQSGPASQQMGESIASTDGSAGG